MNGIVMPFVMSISLGAIAFPTMYVSGMILANMLDNERKRHGK